MTTQLAAEDARIRTYLQRELGEFGSLVRLKSDESMKVNLSREPRNRQPSVYCATVGDSKKIKILFVEDKDNQHFLRIRNLLSGLEGMKMIPKNISISANAIICDFVEGEFPELRSQAFAESYARICATLHQTNVVPKAKDDVLREIGILLDALKSKRKINASIVTRLTEYFTQRLPDTLWYSYVYADLTKDNFVVDENGELVLIDLGSLQKDRLADLFLFTHGLYDSLCEKGFWSEYQRVGGPVAVYADRDVLRALSNVVFASQALTSLKDIRLFDWRKRRSRKAKISVLINELGSIAR